MQSDVICWFLLTLFIGVFADKKEVKQESLVLLFENVTADNVEKDVSLFVNGVRNASLIATFKYVNGYILMEWKADNYKKIFMDATRNIWIANIDETYERKFYIRSSKKQGEVELTILKTNYSTTVRTALNENTQKGDALPDRRSSDTDYASIALLVFLILMVMILIVVIMKKDHKFSWILCKKSNSVLQPVQITSPCDSAHSTLYQLIWNRPNDEYRRQKYILRYREIKPILREHDNIPASTVSYTLSPLTPGRCYQVEIQAINTQGHSCSNYFNFRTKESVPQPVQVTSHRDSPDSTLYQLMWDKPDDGGSPLIKYIIRYCEVEITPNRTEYELSKPLSQFVTVDISPSAVNYTLSSLKPGSYYQVEVKAVNTVGTSSKRFIFKTQEMVPDLQLPAQHDTCPTSPIVTGVPQPVQVTSHHDSPDSTSYWLMWDKPDDGGSPLIKYIIRYCEVEIIPGRTEYELSKYLKPFEFVDNILPSAVSYELSPLTPGRYYLVEIQAINTQGQTLKSFIFKTKEGVPQPVQVTSHHDSPDSTSYKLMWDKPDDGGSPLIKYIILYCQVEIKPDGTEYELSKPLSQLVTVEISPSDVNYTLSSLKPGSYYQVEVQAVNTMGMSPVKFIFKTKESVPQPVQVTSHCDSPDSTSYQLMWDKPDDGESPLIKYIIRYCEVEIIPGRTEYELSKCLKPLEFVDNIPQSAVSYELSPLTPGRYYLVEIQAINTQGQTLKSFIFKTKEGVPQPVQVTSHRDSPDSMSYKLMWDKPDDGGSPLIKYIIRYCEVEIKPDGTEYELSKPLSQLVPVEISPSDVSYTLSPLKPGSYYQVEVQAVNTVGTSSERFIFKTKESAPKQAVKEVVPDFQFAAQHDVHPTSPIVTDETNPKFPRVSKKIKSLEARNFGTVVTGIQCSTINDEQNSKKISKKNTARNMKSFDSKYSHELKALLPEEHVDQNV